MKNYDEALKYLEQSLEILRENNEIVEFEKASKILDNAFTISEKKYQEMIASYYFMTGKMLRLQKNLLKSKEYLEKSINMFLELAIHSGVSKANYELGKFYEERKRNQRNITRFSR